MFARLYHLPEATARRRADELLERFGLADAADRVAGTYSGGMRRRLDLISSLVIAPPVLFLDEPTTGLDPRSRAEIWAAIRSLVADGTTVVLNTQYLDEADQLADQISVIDHGRVIASGTPEELKREIGSSIHVIAGDGADLGAASAALAALTGTEPIVDSGQRQVTVAVTDTTIAEAVRELDRAGVAVEDIAVRRPTLDEVFLRLTSPGAALAGSEAARAGRDAA